MKKIATVILAAMILISFAGIVSGADETRLFTDSLGRTVEIPANVSHVSPSGSLSQIVLYSFDPTSFVTLFGKFSEAEKGYVDESVWSLPITGSMFGSKATMNAEEIIRLDKEIGIDVVVDVGAAKSDVAPGMNDMQSKTGIPFVFITQDKLSDIPESYEMLGRLLGNEIRGKELSDYTAEILKTFEEGMKKVGDNKVKMIYVTKTDGNSVNLLGSGSFHGEVIEYLAENIAPKAVASSGLGDQYTMEDILRMNPDYIIVVGSGHLKHDYYNEIMSSPMWGTLEAVKNGKVYEAPVECPWGWMGNPPASQRLLSLIWLGNLFYPDVFCYDIDEEITEFYSMFYGYEFEEEEFEELMSYAKNKATHRAESPAPVAAVIAGLCAAGAFALRRRMD